MEITLKGIKCDYCDYRDDEVKSLDYPEYIDKPCPKCGHNLLTKKDYYKGKVIVATVTILNFISSTICWIDPFFYYRLITKKQSKPKNITLEFPKSNENE